MNIQGLEFRDFSGGVTDYYLDAPLNKFEEADNFLIFKYGGIGRLFTRPGSEIYDEDFFQIPAGSQRVGTLKYFSSHLIVHSARKFYLPEDAGAGAWTEITGPVTTNSVFPSGVTVSDFVSMAEWNKHLIVTNSAYSKPQKLYPNSSNVLQLRTAGMPALASSPTVTRGAAGAGTYIYRFHYQYTYTVGTVDYIDVGPTTEVTVTACEAPNVSQVAITTIPALANGTTHNYETNSSNLKVIITRTADAGQVFYRVGTVNNGTTTFNDNMSDATLVNQEPLYTEGGYVEVNEPYPSKCVFIVEDFAYYANCKIGTEVHGNRVYQAIPGDIDGIGLDFYTDTPSDIIAGGSFQSIPILACDKGAYRIEGKFDAQGNGYMVAREISATSSCVSERSMVQTPVGVFWAGKDGFYYSDGYRCFRVNKYWDQTYSLLTDDTSKYGRIQGAYDSKKNRVYWIGCDGAVASDNNILWALDLNFVPPSEDMPFTSWSGTSFFPTAIEFESNQLIRGDKRGYILRHEDGLYTDPKIDTGVADANDWVTETIIYSYKSAATNFGSSFERKYVPSMSLQAQNETNISLQIVSDNDDGRSEANLKPIVFKGNLVWGEPDVVWGDPSIIWGGGGLINQKRRMPKDNLRCDYKQIQLTNAYISLFNSEDFGVAAVNASAKTAVLDGTDEWPTNAVDYYISFEADGYSREYLITARTDDTVTFSDSGNNVQNATDANWVIRGYPRGEVLFLMGFIVHYSIFGHTQEPFRQSSLNEIGDSE